MAGDEQCRFVLAPALVEPPLSFGPGFGVIRKTGLPQTHGRSLRSPPECSLEYLDTRLEDFFRAFVYIDREVSSIKLGQETETMCCSVLL